MYIDKNYTIGSYRLYSRGGSCEDLTLPSITCGSNTYYNYKYHSEACYSNRTNELKSASGGAGIGIVTYSELFPANKIVITKKRTGTNQIISGSPVGFNLYNGENCTGTAIYGEGRGTVTFSDLLPGKYSISEEKVPKYYDSSKKGTCVNRSIVIPEGSSGRTVEVTVYNTPTCASDFNDILVASGSVSMTERIKLYKTYKKRNLLNEDITDPGAACTDVYFDINVDLGCLKLKDTIDNSVSILVYSSSDHSRLEGKYKINAFTKRNLSFYNDTIESGGETVGYCLSIPTFDASISDPFVAPLGQMLINSETEDATTGTILKKCYVFKPGISASTITHAYNNFSSYVKNVELIYVSSTGEETQILRNDSDGTFSTLDDYSTCLGNSGCTFKTSRTFNFTKVYSMYGGGKLLYNDCDPLLTCKYYRFLGYGFATKFTDLNYTKTVKDPMVFSFEEANELKLKINNGSCVYDFEDTVTSPGDYEFRETDMTVMFPGKEYEEGKSRKVGTNWRTKDISDLSPTGVYYTCLSTLRGIGDTYKQSKDDFCDLNKDNYLSKIDLEILEYAFEKRILSASDTANKNYLVSYITDVRNDSKNKNGVEKPMYSIVLDSHDMKMFREYNKNVKYDDTSTLTCVEEKCQSSFISGLKEGVIDYASSPLNHTLEVN